MNPVQITTLIVEPDRADHIKRHAISLDEVYEVLTGDYVILKGKLDRWRVIGQTESGGMLTSIVGERAQPGTFGLVTARGLHDDERRFYAAQMQKRGGEDQ